MVDTKALLAELKKLRRALELDARTNSDGAVADAAKAEWAEAFTAKRTADTFETFFTAAIDQSVVHWILAVVFLRFLEDNRLLGAPMISGPGERLELAQARQAEYVRQNPLHTDAEYLLATFAEAAQLPGLSGLYDPAHNPLFRLPLSGDGAMALLGFFRQRDPETGELNFDFSDPDWNTRFLGDLYQDLSELAKKRYALLQTPEFVEKWILDRTLDPAMLEFGGTQARMIDPTCGSGHFLLGGFARILDAWQRQAPEMPPSAQAQRALDAVAGVDLNPFAVEIARFRLLLAALRASGETRLAAAPDFRFQLAVGDSLLHGRHFGLQRDLAHQLDEGFQRRMRHHYADEDTRAIAAILGRQYHAVVGNPPYITPKDPAMRDAYREIYESCHMKYGLGVPFIERFFDLAVTGTRDQAAGFVGLIVANSFMKREFGSKLIEQVLPRLDLTHVVDCAGAYIPGHGTPTAILFGRPRAPVSGLVRTVRGIRGEPRAPDDPARGLVWAAILAQTDQATSTSEFVSTEDTPRSVLAQHPWNMGGGGAADAQARIEQGRPPLGGRVSSIGFGGITAADDIMVADHHDLARAGCESVALKPLVVGDVVRDWRITASGAVIFPYRDQSLMQLGQIPGVARWLWRARTTLGSRATFGKSTYFAEGRPWWEWHQVALDRLDGATVTFGEVATHNHFVLDRGNRVFNRTAPIIKLRLNASEDDHLEVLGLLNSSVACFWLKQVCHNKGSTVDAHGARQRTDPFEDFYQFNGTRLEQFPLALPGPVDLARAIEALAYRYSESLPATVCALQTPTRDALDEARAHAEAARAGMIAVQEELDWRCYRLYGLSDEALAHAAPPALKLGERAFEIVMSRQTAAGGQKTAWFARHGSAPITELPADWPADYRALVERRIALIESDPMIGLLERPEFKRRWLAKAWEEMESEALGRWLLNRLEDRRYWPADEPRLTSTNALADATRKDADFQAVAALFAGNEAFDLEALVADLVAHESVPFLAPLRYAETGLRKHADWEATWELQRREDVIDAELAAMRSQRLEAKAQLMGGRIDTLVEQAVDRDIAAEAAQRKAAEVGAIPVPPKYRTSDFLAQDYWRLRGGLDVPKERFVSFSHCARDADGSLPILWAGYDYLARAKAIAAYFVERKDIDGWQSERLIPLLSGLQELFPWLQQWHNEVDQGTGLRMGDYFAQMVVDEARELGLTLEDLADWRPPAPIRRPRGRRAAA